MHSYAMEQNYFEKSSGCLFCFDQTIVSSSLHHNEANKLFDICCKYLHRAITGEIQNYSPDLLFEKENVPFCEKCLQSAVELSALIEQLEDHQRSISEFIFVFSLRILHRRKNSFPAFDGTRSARKIEEFDISGLPDVVDNDFESLADLTGACVSTFQENDYCQQMTVAEVDNCNVELEAATGLKACGSELLDTSEIILSEVKIEDPLNDVDFCEDSFKLNDIIITTSSTLSSKGTDERRNKSKCLSKEEIANSRLPIVKLERLKLEIIQFGNNRDAAHQAKSTLRIANVKSMQSQNKAFKNRRETGFGSFEVVNVPGAAIKLESLTENLGEEMVEEVVERKRYEGDAPDEAYDPKFGNGGGGNFKCRVCKKKFRFKCVLQNHEKTHSDEKPFCCDVCGKAFKTKHSMLNHGRIHTGEKPYECSICQKRFTFQSGLFIHKFLHTGEKKFQCSVCKKRFVQKGALLSHYKVHTGERRKMGRPLGQADNNHTCNVCGKTLATRQSLMVHESIHSEEKSFPCSVCPKSFRQSSGLYTHMKVHTKPHKCPTCGKRFALKSGLDNHMSKHENGMVEKSLDCSICFKSFNQSSSLYMHMQLHKKPYRCRFCQKRFVSQEELDNHSIQHENGLVSKSLHCSICSKSFKLSSSLYMHMQVHTKPYKCQFCSKRCASQDELDTHMVQHDDQELQCRVCEKTFATKQTLTIHENIHTGEKPFQCDVCFKSFRQSSSLYTHMKVHTKPHKCPTCGKRFALKTALDNHMSRHKGEKRHKCTQCPYATVNPNSLKVHVARKHLGSKCQCRDCGKIFATVDQLKGHYKRIHFAIDYTDDCIVQLN